MAIKYEAYFSRQLSCLIKVCRRYHLVWFSKEKWQTSSYCAGRNSPVATRHPICVIFISFLLLLVFMNPLVSGINIPSSLTTSWFPGCKWKIWSLGYKTNMNHFMKATKTIKWTNIVMYFYYNLIYAIELINMP